MNFQNTVSLLWPICVGCGEAWEIRHHKTKHFLIFKKNLFIFRERGRKGERKGEKH